MKTLAINIPTYNRSKKLLQCLYSLVLQIDKNIRDKIEINIFDNCSSDDTENVVKEFQKKYPYINYFRRPVNIGPDGNFLEILKSNFDCKYYHLMSDDDIFIKDSLVKLVAFLDEYNERFVYLNIEYFWEDIYDQNIKHLTLSNNFENKINISKNDLISIVGNEISFLSGMIFRKDHINTDSLEFAKGTNWLQTYCVFLSTKDNYNDIGFIGCPIVAKRNQDEAKGYNPLVVFGKNYYELIKFGFEKCNYDKKILLTMLSYRWRKLVYWSKIRNKFKLLQESQILTISKQHAELKRVIQFARIPAFICKIYHFIKYKGEK